MNNYGSYIYDFFENAQTIPAQILYDWRSVTGFISGSDLHDAFYGLCGKPSPSGHELIPVEKVRPLLANYRNEFASDEAFKAAALNYDENLDFGVDAIRNLDDVKELGQILRRCDDPKIEAGQFEWPNVYSR